jgi:hypothetical protein
MSPESPPQRPAHAQYRSEEVRLPKRLFALVVDGTNPMLARRGDRMSAKAAWHARCNSSVRGPFVGAHRFSLTRSGK